MAPLEDRLDMSLAEVIQTDWTVPKNPGRDHFSGKDVAVFTNGSSGKAAGRTNVAGSSGKAAGRGRGRGGSLGRSTKGRGGSALKATSRRQVQGKLVRRPGKAIAPRRRLTTPAWRNGSNFSLWRGTAAVKGSGKGYQRTKGPGRGGGKTKGKVQSRTQGQGYGSSSSSSAKGKAKGRIKGKGAGKDYTQRNLLAIAPISKQGGIYKNSRGAPVRKTMNRGITMNRGVKGGGRLAMTRIKGGAKGQGKGGRRQVVTRTGKGAGVARSSNAATRSAAAKSRNRKGTSSKNGKGTRRGSTTSDWGHDDNKGQWQHDKWQHDKFEMEEDAWSRARGANKGKSKGKGQSQGNGKGNEGNGDVNTGTRQETPRGARGASVEQSLSSEDRRMMKKITIVAQLDKVPKPPAAMQSAYLGRGKRSSSPGQSLQPFPPSASGSLSNRFGALEQ